MKIKTLELKATIPTGDYANIQPNIIIEDVENCEESLAAGMELIKGLHLKYSPVKLQEKVQIQAKYTKRSFNEAVDINFDPIEHTYIYKSKLLVSATSYIEKFYKKFDRLGVAKNCASAWNVSQNDVLNLWDSNGQLSASFGNVVHKALEHYTDYRDLGEKIATKKKSEENYALPKHPVLKQIITEFIALDKVKGKIIPEALITDVEGGFCGHADRIVIIDEEKKICRVQDFKINIDSEVKNTDSKPLAPFDALPANKITKYQLQMSIYANMLQKSGWQVEGLDVFVYEEKWKHYKLEVLKLI